MRIFFKQNISLIDIILIRLKELIFSVDNCIVYKLNKSDLQTYSTSEFTLHKSSLYKTGPG